jgi:hypothetical protein
MVLRKSQHGEFYGCSQYPKCKNTEKVELTPPETPIVHQNGLKPQIKQNTNKCVSMYVSYAKDIFCQVYIAGCNKETVMDDCVQLVKQAKEAFE